MLGAAWKLALVFCAIWLAIAFTTRYSSLSALAAAVITPLVAWFMDSPALGLLAALMSVLLLWKHAPNIRRLMSGEEPRIGAKN